MKTIYNILIIVFLILLSYNANAQNLKNDSSKNFYIPTNLRLQHAGNIGMFSFGASWFFLKNRLGLEHSIGFVPKLDAKKNIYVTTIKGIYISKLNLKTKKIIVRPLSVGLAFSYTFGKRLNKYQNTNNYPREYYLWNPACRFGLLYQAEVYSKINHKRIEGVSFYLEASIWDLDIASYIGNSNYSYLNLWDIITLGAGTRIFF